MEKLFSKQLVLAIFIAFFIVITSAFIVKASYISLDITEITLDKPEVQEETYSLITEQDLNFTDKGKFKYIDPYTIDNTTYETHEYETPTGNKGYQIFIKDINSIKSIGYGDESLERTYEYDKPIQDEIVASSTTVK